MIFNHTDMYLASRYFDLWLTNLDGESRGITRTWEQIFYHTGLKNKFRLQYLLIFVYEAMRRS